MTVKRLLALFLSSLLILLTGCGSKAEMGTPIHFYYSVSSENRFGPAIDYETDWMESTAIPDILRRLFRGPDDAANLSRTFPEGTSLQNWSLQEGALSLDLSEAFGRLSGIAMTRAEYCIVLTLTQLEDVEKVSITAGGQTLPGGASQTLSASDVILKGETEDPVTISSQLYFPLEDGSGLGVEYREFEVPTLAVLDQANAVLGQLVIGPKDESMAPFFNGVGQIEAVAVERTICIVNMDNTTLECICRSEDAFDLYLYAIVDSLSELEGVSGVAFRLNGMPVDGWADEYIPLYEF